MTHKRQKKYFSAEGKKCRTLSYSRLLSRISLGLACLAGILHVVTVNDLSIKGFVLNELKRELIAEQLENQNLELAATRLGSYENISRRARDLRMVKIDEIVYLEASAGPVARK